MFFSFFDEDKVEGEWLEGAGRRGGFETGDRPFACVFIFIFLSVSGLVFIRAHALLFVLVLAVLRVYVLAFAPGSLSAISSAPVPLSRTLAHVFAPAHAVA